MQVRAAGMGRLLRLPEAEVVALHHALASPTTIAQARCVRRRFTHTSNSSHIHRMARTYIQWPFSRPSSTKCLQHRPGEWGDKCSLLMVGATTSACGSAPRSGLTRHHRTSQVREEMFHTSHTSKVAHRQTVGRPSARLCCVEILQYRPGEQQLLAVVYSIVVTLATTDACPHL